MSTYANIVRSSTVETTIVPLTFLRDISPMAAPVARKYKNSLVLKTTKTWAAEKYYAQSSHSSSANTSNGVTTSQASSKSSWDSSDCTTKSHDGSLSFGKQVTSISSSTEDAEDGTKAITIEHGSNSVNNQIADEFGKAGPEVYSQQLNTLEGVSSSRVDSMDEIARLMTALSLDCQFTAKYQITACSPPGFPFPIAAPLVPSISNTEQATFQTPSGRILRRPPGLSSPPGIDPSTKPAIHTQTLCGQPRLRRRPPGLLSPSERDLAAKIHTVKKREGEVEPPAAKTLRPPPGLVHPSELGRPAFTGGDQHISTFIPTNMPPCPTNLLLRAERAPFAAWVKGLGERLPIINHWPDPDQEPYTPFNLEDEATPEWVKETPILNHVRFRTQCQDAWCRGECLAKHSNDPDLIRSFYQPAQPSIEEAEERKFWADEEEKHVGRQKPCPHWAEKCYHGHFEPRPVLNRIRPMEIRLNGGGSTTQETTLSYISRFKIRHPDNSTFQIFDGSTDKSITLVEAVEVCSAGTSQLLRSSSQIPEESAATMTSGDTKSESQSEKKAGGHSSAISRFFRRILRKKTKPE